MLAMAAAASAKGLNSHLKDLNGKRLELAELNNGRTLVISFWATWCKPCCSELKHFQKLHETYSDSGVGFLGVCVNEARDQGKVKAFLAGNRYSFQVALDPEQQAMRKFGLKDVPGVFILDETGRIAWRHSGYKPGDEVAMEEEIRKNLKRAITDSAKAEPAGEGRTE